MSSSANSGTLLLVGADPAGCNGSERSGLGPPPPPPPPPPSETTPGRVPVTGTNSRIIGSALPARRRPLSNDALNEQAYEPPAAIQNAMMTRDKKPFTYTPGMGGKLDLSQIRSPRMARRVAKNANDEGIEAPLVQPRPSPSVGHEQRQDRKALPSITGAQPRVAVPVLPTNVLPLDRTSSNETRTDAPMSPPLQPPSPPSPPQITLAKAPTPWLQNRNKAQEDVPEWAKRSSGGTVLSAPSNSVVRQQEPRESSSSSSSSSPPPPAPPPLSPPPPQGEHNSRARERIIPLRIEERPSVFSVAENAERKSSCRRQQRWGNEETSPTIQDRSAPQRTTAAPTPRPSPGGGTYIVPIVVEGSGENAGGHRVVVQRGPLSPQHQTSTQHQQAGELAPVQSRSFRVLQKITDTDFPPDQQRAEGSQQQQRKLRLDDNDKILMNKVKERVDGEQGAYLHREEDPRYRGAAIPSRAFRYLRNMTDSGDACTNASAAAPAAPATVAASPGASRTRQSRNSPPLEEQQCRTSLPASEQQAPEPKKYTGSAIPSRSFRMLQAMTSPESIGPDRSDY